MCIRDRKWPTLGRSNRENLADHSLYAVHEKRRASLPPCRRGGRATGAEATVELGSSYSESGRSGISPLRRASAWISGGSVRASTIRPLHSTIQAIGLFASSFRRENSGPKCCTFKSSRTCFPLLLSVLLETPVRSLS